MLRDLTPLLWLLKLGALVNLYFLARTLAFDPGSADPRIVIPAQIFFAVSAFRCLFPGRYKDNVVFHDTPLSSTFLTRVLATFSEVAFIYLLSHVIRLLNVDAVGWVDALSWLMVAQVVVSQLFVWAAIVSGRLSLYFYEELGWGVIITAQTIASAFLYATVEGLAGKELLLQLNLLFGAIYLPWQVIHLRALRSDARSNGAATGAGLHEAIHVRNRKTDGEAWGGIVGLTWMVGYWATLLPLWVHQIVWTLSAS